MFTRNLRMYMYFVTHACIPKSIKQPDVVFFFSFSKNDSVSDKSNSIWFPSKTRQVCTMATTCSITEHYRDTAN